MQNVFECHLSIILNALSDIIIFGMFMCTTCVMFMLRYMSEIGE